MQSGLPDGRSGRYDATKRRADVIALLSARRDEMVHRFGVRSLSLFGSMARDEARPDSDVDALVEFDGPTTSTAIWVCSCSSRISLADVWTS